MCGIFGLASIRRNASLVWPCNIWRLLLSIDRLCFIFGVSWAIVITIFGAVGVRFGSQNRSFWVPESLLAPWKTKYRKDPEKEIKNRILILGIGRLCCIFDVCSGLLVTILGALGVHFKNQNHSFWVPGGALSILKKLIPEKSSKRGKRIIGVLPFWRPFWLHFWMIFESILWYVFWFIFGTVLDQFWEPRWIQKR